MDTKDKNVSQNALPRGFSGKIALFFMNRGHRNIYENMNKALVLKPDDDLLEVACGNGYFLRKYASHVNSVAGLDISELCIDMSIRNNRDRVKNGTAKFMHGDASKLPWEDGIFSVVTSMGSFSMFPSSLDSLKEMYRVLRPGGRVVIGIEWNAEDGKDHSKEIEKYGYQIRSEDEVKTMLQDAGFTEVAFTYYKGLMIPKGMIAMGIRP